MICDILSAKISVDEVSFSSTGQDGDGELTDEAIWLHLNVVLSYGSQYYTE